MNMFIFGNGNAREHATFMALRRELGGDDRVSFALDADNALLQALPGVIPVRGVAAALDAAVASCADIALVLTAKPLVEGVADRFAAAGIRVFGVPAATAALEGSKLFGKRAMAAGGVPTPLWRAFDGMHDACAFLRDTWRPGAREFVIKAEGYFAAPYLRTMVPRGPTEACEAVASLFRHGAPCVVVEQKIAGPELSVHVLFDGRDYRLLPQVADQKRLFAGDEGPMTDGMGALATTLPWPPELERALRTRLIEPTLQAILRLGLAYRGVLYIGAMITEDGPVCLEYNVRPGNPEWPAILALLDQPLAALVEAVTEQRVASLPSVSTRPRFAAAAFVVGAGYPTESPREPPGCIRGLGDLDPDIEVLGESVRRSAVGLKPGHGRVLALVARDERVAAVRHRLMANLQRVHFNGMYWREDVAGQTLFTDTELSCPITRAA